MIKSDLPEPIPVAGICSASPVDWVEDWEHENSIYQCTCVYCRTAFIGHKRRVICHRCADGKHPSAARLYNNYEALTPIGAEINDVAHDFARDLIRQYMAAGYSGRDIESAILSGVAGACAEEILRHATELRKSLR